MKELQVNEVQEVSGAGFLQGAGAFGLSLGIGSAAFGSGWGAVGAGLAFASAPLTVTVMLGLAFYAGYQMAS
ncbi:hypothetical protein [Rheinheimera sp.]|uniref:hypothetical protein n=1 Tax=Rheinheimera sp. TaxID=1869214 RepID=UPI00307F0D91